MNENCATMPVGKQLLAILGDKPDKAFSDGEMNRILDLLVQSKELAIECRKAMGQESAIDEHELIDTLFAKKRTCMSDIQARMFTACMAQCCAEMLGWCIERVKQDCHVPYHLLRNFVLDASWSGFLGGRFSAPSGAFRSMKWLPPDVFVQSARLFLWDRQPMRLVTEFMIIFEMRQAVEVAVCNAIGLGNVEPKVIVNHSVLWKAFKDRAISRGFQAGGDRWNLEDAEKVYKWTHTSVHGMETDYVFVVWKAVMVFLQLFSQPLTDENERAYNIDWFFEMTIRSLEEVRNEIVCFVRCKLRAINRNRRRLAHHVTEFTITWNKPTVLLKGDDGATVMDYPSEARVYQVNPSNNP